MSRAERRDRGIASIGRLPFLGSLTHTEAGGAHAARRSNSAQRLGALSGAFTVSDELVGALARSAGPVLLVDDYTDSGWTLSLVAARLLRQAGSGQVLPLVLAAAG